MFLPLFPTKQRRTISRSMFWHRNMCFFCDSLVTAEKHDREEPARCSLAWPLPLSHVPPAESDSQKGRTVLCGCIRLLYFYLPIILNYQAMRKVAGLQLRQLCRPYGWNVCGSRRTDTRSVLVTELCKSKNACHGHVLTPEWMFSFHGCDQDRAWIAPGA